MADLALYRKYRSASFGEVVGQEHVVSTLVNALASGRTSHAYLFSGPRGVGKTSLARLLARGLNCTGEPKPCGKCPNCLADLAGNLDLIEIDGASNRGIDEIRDLRDKISLAPSLGRYKVYIIDEVHMLTDAAFNALLKTLEEPPAHAVFILATTEAHKLPATIISRTQHFQFTPTKLEHLLQQLRHIAGLEKITIDDEALTLIAKSSRGGFRDAISLLDQVASSGEEKIDVSLVRQFLGLGDTTIVNKLLEAVLERKLPAVLESIDALLASGLAVGQIVAQLLTELRELLTTSASSNDTSQVGPVLTAIEELLPVTKSAWPELALEAALARLCLGDTASVAPAAVTAAAMRPATSASVAPAPAAQTKPASQDDQALWLKTLTIIKSHNNSLYALLRSCEIDQSADQILVYCRFNFHRDRLEEPKNRQIIERSLDQAYGRKVRLISELQTSTQAPAPTPTEASSELVSSAIDILGGEVVYE